MSWKKNVGAKLERTCYNKIWLPGTQIPMSSRVLYGRKTQYVSVQKRIDLAIKY